MSRHDANNDALPKLPQKVVFPFTWDERPRMGYTADQMRDYAHAAIRALSADRGEAAPPVAWADPASMQGYTLGAYGDFAAGDKSDILTVPLYEHPPSPAEGVLTHPYTGNPRDYRDVNSDPEGLLCTPPGPLRAAAPSQVSMMVPTFTAVARGKMRSLEADGFIVDGVTMRSDHKRERCTLTHMGRVEWIAQPQPGRVEGMVLVPAGKLRAWRDLIGAAPDGVKTEIKDLLATAGGDA